MDSDSKRSVIRAALLAATVGMSVGGIATASAAEADDTSTASPRAANRSATAPGNTVASTQAVVETWGESGDGGWMEIGPIRPMMKKAATDSEFWRG